MTLQCKCVVINSGLFLLKEEGLAMRVRQPTRTTRCPISSRLQLVHWHGMWVLLKSAAILTLTRENNLEISVS